MPMFPRMRCLGFDVSEHAEVLKCCFCGNFHPWILGRVEKVTKRLEDSGS